MLAGVHESGFDLLLTPTLAEPPPPLGSFDDSGPDPMAAFERAFLDGCFTAAFNATGQPAISLPLHWTEEGLPIGVQLVAPLGPRGPAAAGRRTARAGRPVGRPAVARLAV